MSSSPGQRALVFVGVGAALAAAVADHAAAGGRDRATMISIKRPSAVDPAYGGEGYGAVAPPSTSAYVTHERAIDVGADGVVKFPGVAALLDAATVEFRSATDPAGTRVVEQRLVNDVINPEALLFRQLGKPVVLTLASGELAGTLRALSADALVIDSDDHAAHIVPRGPQLLGIKLPTASVDQEPTLEWRITTAKPGRHDVVVSYRTDGLAWQPDYSAVLGEDGAVDLSAWATISNDTGSDFTDVDLTLTAGGGDGVFATLGLAPGRPSRTKPQDWKIAGKIGLRAGQTVQVELAPKKVGAKAKQTQVFEALAEGAGADNAQATSDCDAYEPLNPRTGQYLEIEAGAPLPSGRVRLLRRVGKELTVVGTDELRANASTGVVRIALSGADVTVSGERNRAQCQLEPSGRALREDVELTVTNDGAAAADVVVREAMYRWHTWKLTRESVKGTRADERVQEWRVRLGKGESKTISYTVQYSW